MGKLADKLLQSLQEVIEEKAVLAYKNKQLNAKLQSTQSKLKMAQMSVEANKEIINDQKIQIELLNGKRDIKRKIDKDNEITWK